MMNQFKYMAALKELQICSTIKKLEQLIRQYQDQLTKTNVIAYHRSSAEKTYENQILNYKLLTLALKLFKDRSKATLPDFLWDTHRKAQNYILLYILNNEPYSEDVPIEYRSVDYAELMNIFEFDSHIELPNKYYYVEKLNTIIDNNPIHFTIKFNNRLTDFDRYSTSLEFDKPKQYVYAVRHKQVNFPNKPQTVWDMFLANLYDTEDITKINESITKLQQQINALTYYKEQVNESI